MTPLQDNVELKTGVSQKEFLYKLWFSGLPGNLHGGTPKPEVRSGLTSCRSSCRFLSELREFIVLPLTA